MSIVSIVGMFGYIFMSFTNTASDQEWITYVILMIVKIIGGSIALGWGIITIVYEYGRCSISSPRTYLYSFASTLLLIVALLLISITVFIRIMPSLVHQAYVRSRLI